jgi:hypothetical protein
MALRRGDGTDLAVFHHHRARRRLHHRLVAREAGPGKQLQDGLCFIPGELLRLHFHRFTVRAFAEQIERNAPVQIQQVRLRVVGSPRDRLTRFAVEVDAGRRNRSERMGRIAFHRHVQGDLRLARRIKLVRAGGELSRRRLHAVVVKTVLLVDPQFEVLQFGFFGIGGLFERFCE